jgi:hypothetical protein
VRYLLLNCLVCLSVLLQLAELFPEGSHITSRIICKPYSGTTGHNHPQSFQPSGLVCRPHIRSASRTDHHVRSMHDSTVSAEPARALKMTKRVRFNDTPMIIDLDAPTTSERDHLVSISYESQKILQSEEKRLQAAVSSRTARWVYQQSVFTV